MKQNWDSGDHDGGNWTLADRDGNQTDNGHGFSLGGEDAVAASLAP